MAEFLNIEVGEQRSHDMVGFNFYRRACCEGKCGRCGLGRLRELLDNEGDAAGGTPDFSAAVTGDGSAPGSGAPSAASAAASADAAGAAAGAGAAVAGNGAGAAVAAAQESIGEPVYICSRKLKTNS
jgi:hypothetical protein